MSKPRKPKPARKLTFEGCQVRIGDRTFPAKLVPLKYREKRTTTTHKATVRVTRGMGTVDVVVDLDPRWLK